MSAIPAGCCGRPTGDGATVCPAHAHELDEMVSIVGAFHGLAWTLEVAYTRQDRIGQRNGGRSAETSLPWNDKASDASKALYAALRRWADVVARETRDNAPPAELAPLARWLRPRIGWLRHHQHGADAYHDIRAVYKAAVRVVGPPPDLVYAGPCGEPLPNGEGDCPDDLYAFPGAAYVSCRCGAVWDVLDRRRWLLEAVEDQLATAKEISRALTAYAFEVTESMIRNYANRKDKSGNPAPLLVPRGRNSAGTLLYRIGDVLDVATRVVEKTKVAS